MNAAEVGNREMEKWKAEVSAFAAWLHENPRVPLPHIERMVDWLDVRLLPVDLATLRAAYAATRKGRV